MGSVCGKASSAVKDSEYSPKQRELRRKTSELLAARAISANREGNATFSMKEKYENGDKRIGLVDKKSSTMSRRVRDDFHENKREGCEVMSNFPSMSTVPKALQGEQVAAGWPNWLVAVAGEAINGWIPRKADTYEKLDKIGQGTYSSVYKGRDILNNKAVALKKVRFDNMDPESVKFMAREILILRRLDHPNVIKLEALVTSRTSASLYLVFEYMEHDLTGIASLPGVKFTEPQVKCYMQQLLSGLDYCHSNGVLHRDIKGSNLLVDNNGILKIADFGLASYFDNRQSVPLTSRVVTLWYRPPELLLGATNYGVAVDLWSSGCILGELYTGKPIMPGRTEVEQLHKIFKLCGSPSEEYWRKTKLPHSTVFKPTQPYRKRIAETLRDLPYAAVELMETLLSVDPSDRGTASTALNSEFFKTEPLPCDPLSLPKYPPSKEIDAKLREEEARRRGLSGVKGQKVENNLNRLKESKAAPAPHANAELASSLLRRQDHPNTKSKSEYFNPQKEEACSDFRVNPPRYSQAPKGTNKSSSPKNGLSSLSGLVTTRVFSSVEARDKSDLLQAEPTNQECRLSESFGDHIKNQDRRTHSQVFRGSHQLQHGRASTKEPTDGHGHREERIHFSGPLVAPSNNIEQILKEHDRRIQEVARRLRNEKGKGGGRARPSQEPHVMSYNSSQRVGNTARTSDLVFR